METIKSKLAVILILLGGSQLFVRCSSDADGESGGIEVQTAEDQGGGISVTDAQFKTMAMEWGKLETKNFSDEIKVQGEVKIPVEGMQDITPFFGGYVSGLSLVEGQAIRKGEVLFYLESPEFIRLQQNYLEAKSQLGYLKQEYERQKTLFGEKIASQKGYVKAESDYQTTLAQAESLKKQLGMIHVNADNLTAETIKERVPIISPISGFVEGIFTVPGAYLPSASKALTLISTKHLHIELNVFEKDAVYLKEGQQVSFTLPDVSGKVFEAKIHVVGKSISENRYVPVHADLLDENKGNNLVPGMFLEAKIKLGPQDGLALPTTAVVEEEGTNYVLVETGVEGTVHHLGKVEVKLGRQNDQLVEVLPNPNLDENSKILTKGGFTLL